MFFTAAAPFYIPTKSEQGFQFLQNLTNTCYLFICLFVYLFIFDDSHSNRCDVISHCVFDVHFPDD